MAQLARLLADPGLLRDKAYIDGGWASADSRLAVTDPATGGTVAEVARLDAAQSRQAVDAAARAFPGWSSDLPQKRGGLLRRWFELICRHREDLALIMVAEQGKPLSEARGEIDYAASFVEFYAEEAKRPNIEGVTSHLPDAEVEVWREPVGVAALVTPWNFPAAMLTRKAGAALAAAAPWCRIPRETPLSALALAELAERAGLPPACSTW
jgi:aspartate-semialdehyde dehydrogenase